MRELKLGDTVVYTVKTILRTQTFYGVLTAGVRAGQPTHAVRVPAFHAPRRLPVLSDDEIVLVDGIPHTVTFMGLGHGDFLYFMPCAATEQQDNKEISCANA